MDVLAFCVLVIALAAFVAAPLYRPRPSRRADEAGEVATARLQAVERALDDLDVDRASGLVDEPDYARERADLRAEADALDAPAARPSD